MKIVRMNLRQRKIDTESSKGFTLNTSYNCLNVVSIGYPDLSLFPWKFGSFGKFVRCAGGEFKFLPYRNKPWLTFNCKSENTNNCSQYSTLRCFFYVLADSGSTEEVPGYESCRPNESKSGIGGTTPQSTFTWFWSESNIKPSPEDWGQNWNWYWLWIGFETKVNPEAGNWNEIRYWFWRGSKA